MDIAKPNTLAVVTNELIDIVGQVTILIILVIVFLFDQDEKNAVKEDLLKTPINHRLS